jgi:alpha-galactosidase
MNRTMTLAFIVLVLSFSMGTSQTVWLDKLDLSTMTCGWNYYPHANKNVRGTTFNLAGRTFQRGVGTSPMSTFLLNVNGDGLRFSATVGLDESADSNGTASFFVLGDKKVLWESGLMKKGDAGKELNLDIKGIDQLGLLVTGHGSRANVADWCNAKIEMNNIVPESVLLPARNYYILSPKAPDAPRINSAKVFGTRPGNPVYFTIGASGLHPMIFRAEHLPDGLNLNSTNGQITGTIEKAGEYKVTLLAENSLGRAKQTLTISVGDDIALTPPMGWNSWNAWGKTVDDAKVRAAANALVKTGLIDYGWNYVVVDGGWSVNPKSTDSLTGGQPYDSLGRINANGKFSDMKALGTYIHSEGLTFGIHTSPGPGTCADWTACYGHELQCAERFADWGVDYIKYDWCSYTRIAKDNSLRELQKPFVFMRSILDGIHRDIVFSINPGPEGRKSDPWTWGKVVGANMWRTTGDINDSWQSVSHIGFTQIHGTYAQPGHWNDPDMLTVGRLGLESSQHPSKLTPDEQYSHISLWCLLSAPLMLGCDLTNVDDFTMNLITNNEVLALDQDPLGNQATRIYDENGKQIWAKQLKDGSRAVGLFWVGQQDKTPADHFRWVDDQKKIKITLESSQFGIKGKFKVRDLWSQKDLGTFENHFTAEVPFHGVALLKVEGIQ